MRCIIAAEPGAAEVIRENLQRRFLDWQFEAVTSADRLFQFSGEKPDVVVVSRFLSSEPENVLKRLLVEFPVSHIVLLTGILNEQAKAYVRLAARYGLTNVVTGKLPGDKPYTLFAALTQVRQELLEVEECLEWEEETLAEGNGTKEANPASVQTQNEGDILTGCYTRRYLENIRPEATYAVVFIDLDNFGSVNNILGREAGDRVLAAFGKMLQRNLGDRGVSVRWSEDEFVLVLPGVSKRDAEKVVRKLRQTWRECAPETGSLEVGFSVGVAEWRSGDIGAVIKEANRQMYAEKRNRKTARDWGQPEGQKGCAVQMVKQGYATWLEMLSSGEKKAPVVPAGQVRAVDPLTNVVGFYSGTKGSVGKTTCSANLAAWLVSRGYKVAVVDADPSTRGMTVLAFGSDESAWPERASVRSGFGGLVVYPPLLAAKLPKISGMYDYVLLDFGTQFNSATLDLLGACGTVVLMTVPEQLAVNVISRFMYRERGNVRGRLCLVVNRVKPRAEVPPWRVGEILGLPVLAVLPETDEVGKAAKKGTLPVLAFRKGAMVEGISALWEKLGLKTSPPAKRTRQWVNWWRFLKRGERP